MIEQYLLVVSTLLHIISIPLIIYLIRHNQKHRKLLVEHMGIIEKHIEQLELMNK